MGVCICCLCCLTSQTAQCIEISLMIQNVVSFFLYIWALAALQWNYINKSGLVLFILSYILNFYSMAILFLFFTFRKKKLINADKNKISKTLGYTMYAADVLALILLFISEIIITNGLNKKIREVVDSLDYGETAPNPVSVSCRVALYIAVTGIEILWLLNIFFWASDMMLIKLRIDGPYSKYVREANMAANVQRQVQVMGQMGMGAPGPYPGIPGLVIVGYDENGNPLYGQPGVYVADVQNYAVNIGVNMAGQANVGMGSNEPINQNKNKTKNTNDGQKSHPLDDAFSDEGKNDAIKDDDNRQDDSNQNSVGVQGLGYGEKYENDSNNVDNKIDDDEDDE